MLDSTSVRSTRKVNMLDENKVSAVHYAARHNHLDVLRLLVSNLLPRNQNRNQILQVYL